MFALIRKEFEMRILIEIRLPRRPRRTGLDRLEHFPFLSDLIHLVVILEAQAYSRSSQLCCILLPPKINCIINFPVNFYTYCAHTVIRKIKRVDCESEAFKWDNVEGSEAEEI